MRSHIFTATGLGSKSLASGKLTALSPRREVDFDCPAHHHFSITFSTEAHLPTSWECPTCWARAVRSDGVRAEAELTRPTRTHWDRLLERRSVAELEEILSERLALLRSGAIGPSAHERITKIGKSEAA